jgi:hypothetical protein
MFLTICRLWSFLKRTLENMTVTMTTQICLSAPGAKVRHPVWRSDFAAQGNVEDFF